MFWEEKPKKTNPVGQFYTWKSGKDKTKSRFVWWNKEVQQELDILPTEFILLSQTACIKWRDNESNSWIYSNEITNIKNDTLIVKSFKWGKTLYEWTYDKDEISKIWWEFHRWIVALEWDTLIEYYLKWGALFQWNTDLETINTEEYKVKFDKVEERKKWAITYYVPRFIQGSPITDEEREQWIAMVSVLKDYLNKDE